MFRFYFKTIEIKPKYINGLSCILYLTLDLTRVLLNLPDVFLRDVFYLVSY